MPSFFFALKKLTAADRGRLWGGLGDCSSRSARQRSELIEDDRVENLFQTPDDAVTYLRRQYGDHPPTWLILWANRPGMTYEESTAHHRLFMEKVAPHLKDLG